MTPCGIRRQQALGKPTPDGNLRDARALLVALATHHGFDVPETWL